MTEKACPPCSWQNSTNAAQACQHADQAESSRQRSSGSQSGNEPSRRASSASFSRSGRILWKAVSDRFCINTLCADRPYRGFPKICPCHTGTLPNNNVKFYICFPGTNTILLSLQPLSSWFFLSLMTPRTLRISELVSSRNSSGESRVQQIVIRQLAHVHSKHLLPTALASGCSNKCRANLQQTLALSPAMSS